MMGKKSKNAAGGKAGKRWRYHRGRLFGSAAFEQAYARWNKGVRGICGPTAVTIAIGGNSGAALEEVINCWEGGFSGLAPIKNVERELERRGIASERMRVTQRAPLALPEGVTAALVYVQWGKATHWLHLKRIKGKLHGACSLYGRFKEGGAVFRRYLEPSDENFMRRYLVLERARGAA